ncbi:MAG: hypothetical protein HOC70_13120 [Gammaproteobacteria bacterium]|nr:hypothetical protein [Gammaproteobacteria bacterium]MBT4494176.1 hypothetical protein [Gammaproteobacteria bacterium]MBT7372351.1 hypothetical protein [Gammaproteobacteria bacterium]
MLRFFLYLMVFALLSGCVAHRIEPIPPGVWRFSGKLSLQTSEESRILSIDWYQAGEVSEIVLKGPLGVKVATIRADQGELIVDRGGQVVRYRDDDVLMQTGFEGLKLPWKSLSYWVRGHTEHGGQQLTSSEVKRGDWYFRITETGIEGPLAMTLEHPRVKLRLRVRQWVISAEETPLQKI